MFHFLFSRKIRCNDMNDVHLLVNHQDDRIASAAKTHVLYKEDESWEQLLDAIQAVETGKLPRSFENESSKV